MTPSTGSGWIKAPAVPAMAAPLRAVDVWRPGRADGELALTARVSVRGDDPNLRGHFPGLPIFPGVFVLEALTQAMALAAAQARAGRPVLRAVRSVRFLAPLLDGDELTLNVTASPLPGGGLDVAAKASRADGTLSAKVRADFDLCEPASA
jgi:3-hydroxyacyl-[acyl-carrier-protein] dehydratase